VVVVTVLDGATAAARVETAELFDVAPFVVEKPAKVARPRKVLGPDQVAWSSYAPKKRTPCDACLAALVDAPPIAPLAASARWKRRQGQDVELLCVEHRGERLVADGRGGAR